MTFRKLFADTNILMDYVLERANTELVRAIVRSSANNKYIICISISSVCTLVYFLEKWKMPLDEIKESLIDISDAFLLINTSPYDILTSARSNFTDLEDAILHFTAVSNECDAFITQNIKDFPKSLEIPIFTPEQMIKELDEAN